MKGRGLNAQGQLVYENSLLYGVYAASDDEGSVAGNYSNRWPARRPVPRARPRRSGVSSPARS